MKRLSPATAVAALFRTFRPRPASRLARWAALAGIAVAPMAGAVGLDTAFGTYGVQLLEYLTEVHTIAHLPRSDGGSVTVSTLKGGACNTDFQCLYVQGFRDDGSLHFDVAVQSWNLFTKVEAAAIDSQDRIVVVGSIKVGSGADHDFRVVRLTAAGELDATFGAGGIANVFFDVSGSSYDDRAYAVAIDGSDRIVVAGYAAVSPTDEYEFAVTRLTQGGILDSSFGGGRMRIPFPINPARRWNIATAVAIDSAGGIVIGGPVFDQGLGISRIGIARLTPNGAYDTTWCSPSCGAGNAYPGINSGRSVPYYGFISDQRDHTVAALAVNASGVVAIVGNMTFNGVTTGYAMTLLANGGWKAEREVNGGANRALMGGVLFVSPAAPDSDLVVTGVSGYPVADRSWFFAQRLTNSIGLAPRAGWGQFGDGRSTFVFDSRGALNGNQYGNVPHASSIDAKGRILMSGAANLSSIQGLAARLGDALFRNGFEE